MSRLTALVACFVVALSLGAPSPASARSSCYRYHRSELNFMHKTNAARRRQGHSSLRLDPQLARVARKHSVEMARRRSLVHTPLSRLARRVTRWRSLGENIGYGFSVKSVQRAFLHSPLHRHNIMSTKFRNVGVGTVKHNGAMWVTVVFEGTRNPGTRLSMPSC